MSKRKPKVKGIPRFSSEDEEREFWASHSVVDYFDWAHAIQPTFPNLKPSTTSISIRLSISMLEELKSLANAKDVPYQSLMKVFLSDCLVRERTREKYRPEARGRLK